MPQLRQKIVELPERVRRKKARATQREVMTTLFDDMYSHRRRVYKLNFVRGIFFGLGSVLGGTLVVAIVIWILTWFIDFPLIGQWIERLINALPAR